MPIDAGDIVLTALIDLTQANTALNQLGTDVPAKLGAATNSVGGLGTALQGAGAAATDAGAQVEQVIPPVEKLTGSYHEARGEIGLINEASREAFGVGMPRHVLSFIASLEGIQPVLSAAFAATAIFFIIEAIAKVIEKVHEFGEANQKIAEGWDKVHDAQSKLFNHLEDDLLRAQIKTAELTNNHLEALRLKLTLINNVSLSQLESELDKIGKDADAMFKKMDRNWFTKLLGFEGSEEAKAKFDEISKEVDKALSSRTPEAFAEALKVVNKAIDDSSKKFNELTAQEAAFEKAKSSALSARAFSAADAPPPVDPRTIQSYEELGKAVREVKKDLEEKRNAKETEEDNAELENDKKIAAEAEKAAKKREEAARHAAELEKRLLSESATAYKQFFDERLREVEYIEKGREKAAKEGEKAAKDQITVLRQQEAAQQAFLDGEIQQEEAAGEKKAERLKIEYDTKIITGRQYLAALQQLNNSEVQDLIKLLNQKEQLVIKEAQAEALLHGKILSDEDAKELKAVIQLENAKAKVRAQADLKLEKAEDQVQKRLEKGYKTLGDRVLGYTQQLDKATAQLNGFGQTANKVLTGITANWDSAIKDWITGQESLGAALKKALADQLAAWGAQDAVSALRATALGLFLLAQWDFEGAGHAFAAAGEYAAVAALEGGAARGLGAGDKSGTSGGGTGASTASNAPDTAKQPEQQPVSVVNVQHFATGALVNTPRLAVVGDVPEAIIPSGSNSRILDDLADRVTWRMQHAVAGTHGDIYITIEPGMNTHQLVHKISRDVNQGKIRLKASDSIRVTRRS